MMFLMSYHKQQKKNFSWLNTQDEKYQHRKREMGICTQKEFRIMATYQHSFVVKKIRRKKKNGEASLSNLSLSIIRLLHLRSLVPTRPLCLNSAVINYSRG